MSRIAAVSLVGLAEGAGISVNSGGGVGTEWAPGAWVEWSAALAEDIYLAACECHSASTGLLTGIEIGVGAAGVEAVVVAQGYGKQAGGAGDGNTALFTFSTPVFFAAGSRVAVRIRVRVNSAVTLDPVRLKIYGLSYRCSYFILSLNGNRDFCPNEVFKCFCNYRNNDSSKE